MPNGNPYKGLFSYDEKDKKHFYGREIEKRELFDLISQNPNIVVFGKSGIGKTSLLNAGVLPILDEEGFLPVRLRLNFSQEAAPLMDQVRLAMQGEFDEHKIEVMAAAGEYHGKPLAPDETMWEYFQRAGHFYPPEKEKTDKKVIPVLVFDQFEEIFTLGRNRHDRERLIDELYWLIENQVPPQDRLKREIKTPIKRPMDIRVILSLREDYLPHLDDLKMKISSIDHVKFRVKHLNGIQAREIISMPGGFTDEGLISKILRFFYPERVRDDETKRIADEKLVVEPAFLSLLCFQFKKKGVKSITSEDQGRILADFYDFEVKAFPDYVKRFIESKLLTDGGFRTRFRLDPVLDQAMRENLEELVNRRILRRFYDEEKEYIEISHDVLAPIVKEKRARRVEAKKKEKFKKRFYKIAAIIGFIAAILFALLYIYANYQKNRADEQVENVRELNVISEAALELPRDNTRAIRIAGEAYKMGLPVPLPRTYQVLSAAAYSSFEEPFYAAILRHNDSLSSALLSPDNTMILTACDDRTARLWDLNGKLLKEFKHDGKVETAVFSPDGKYILTASQDRSARLWDTESKLLEFFMHEGIVESAVFSPEGDRILTASRDGTAKLWNPEGEMQVNFPCDGPIFSALFSTDGSRILTVSWFEGVKLWNPEGKLLLTLKHDGEVVFAVFSPESDRVLTTSEDGIINIWNLQGDLLENLELNGGLTSAVFSPGGDRILTAAKDGLAQVWNRKGDLIENIKCYGALSSAVFSADGSRILTASSEGIAKLSYLKNKFLINLDKHHADVNVALFSPYGNRILTVSRDGIAKLWDLEGKLLTDLPHKGNVNSAAFSPHGGRYIVTASEDKTAKLWDKHGKFVREFYHKGAVTSTMFSPDGKRILTTSPGYGANLWWRERNKKPVQFSHPDDVVTGALFSPDGLRILTTTINGALRLWSFKDKLWTGTDYPAHKGRIHSAVFSYDGSRILTASEDGTAKLWKPDGTLLEDFDQHNGPVYSAVFSADGSRILTASKDGTAKLWNLDGTLLKDFKHRGAVYSAIFSHDNHRILTASEDGTAKLWNLDGEILADLNKHKKAVRSARFSPGDRLILTASADGTAKVWYTPEAIYEWLKTAKIPKLSEDEKKRLGIREDQK